MMSYRDLDPDPDGVFGVFNGKTALGGGREGESLESRVASTVRTPSDANYKMTPRRKQTLNRAGRTSSRGYKW